MRVRPTVLCSRAHFGVSRVLRLSSEVPELGEVVHTSISSRWEADVGGSLWVQDQPDLHCESQAS